MQLDAKNIYVSQLTDVIGPPILKAIGGLLAEVQRESRSKVLLRFQKKLKDIPVWNSEIIRQHTAAIEAKAPYLERLIAVTFLSFVKVMSSVRLRDDSKPNIRIRLPSTDSFVHRCFIAVARDFYNDPHTKVDEYEGMRVAVERSIRDSLPLSDILDAYLGGVEVDAQNTVSPELDNDASSPENDFDDADTPASSMPAPHEYQHQHQPTQEHQPGTMETRTISIPQVKADDELFSDADDDDADWKAASPPSVSPGPPGPPPPHPTSTPRSIIPTIPKSTYSPLPPTLPSQLLPLRQHSHTTMRPTRRKESRIFYFRSQYAGIP